MKKKPTENASTVNNDEETTSNSEEVFINNVNEEETIKSPEAKSSVTTSNVIKTRH